MHPQSQVVEHSMCVICCLSASVCCVLHHWGTQKVAVHLIKAAAEALHDISDIVEHVSDISDIVKATSCSTWDALPGHHDQACYARPEQVIISQ
jgi:hypothetical protein